MQLWNIRAHLKTRRYQCMDIREPVFQQVGEQVIQYGIET